MRHNLRKLDGVQLRVAAIVGKRPRDITVAEVVALQGKADPLKVKSVFFLPAIGVD